MNIFEEKIKNVKTICILGHQNPDGDCIGASLAIYNYIKNEYKEEKIVKIFLDEFSEKYKSLKNADKIKSDMGDATIFDLCIVVDSSNMDRIKNYERYFNEAKDTIVFDHHENNTIPAKVSVVFPDSIATCEILYKFFNKEYIDKDVAMCLYMGIATDSGIFRYRDTKSSTMKVAAELIEYDFNFTKLLDNIVFFNTFAQRKAQGIAFDRLKLLCKGKVSFSYLDDNDLSKLNLTKNDIDNVIVYLREIYNIKVAVFAYQVGDKIFKISLRSNEDSINLAEFAIKHDGGGHKLAAGCMYYGEIETVEEHIAKDLGEFIENCENDK